MIFKRDNILLEELVLVDGVGRSGKVMLAEILTGFNRVEKQEYNEFLEYIALANHYDKISKDIAITILKTQMDTEIYKMMIGRSINTRLTDYTSLYNYHTPKKYLKRQVEEDGSIIGLKVKEEKPIYLNWCHDMIQKSQIIFEAFEDKIKLIYINRRPIDIIYEWNKKNFGARISSDPTEMQYLIEYGAKLVPELAYGWEDEYLSLNNEERVVKMIYTSFKRNYEAIVNLNNSQIKIINFEDLVTRPDDLIKELGIFLNLNENEFMKNILLKENCPRILDDKTYIKRRDDIFSSVSNEFLELIDELDELYEKISKYGNEETL